MTDQTPLPWDDETVVILEFRRGFGLSEERSGFGDFSGEEGGWSFRGAKRDYGQHSRRFTIPVSGCATVPRHDASQLIHRRQLVDTFSRGGQAENFGVAKVVVDCGQCSFQVTSQQVRTLL